ncbi:MAG TPA: hypothetical protein VKV04_14070 [Verrucomicrobiae bacterium]|nr:hypothetical protein [Verrucomicrobiae bacterium]
MQAPEEPIRYYNNRGSAGAFAAIVATFGVITVGSSLAAHSFLLTSCLLLGAVAIACLGYWALSKSCYFISSTGLGFKDAFRLREVQFDEIQSVTKNVGRDYMNLAFVCKTRIVTMPFDPLDLAWYPAVKVELHKRDIPISSTAFGITQKEE